MPGANSDQMPRHIRARQERRLPGVPLSQTTNIADIPTIIF